MHALLLLVSKSPLSARLSVGRDVVLEPPQAGERLNYFLAPYAEADGKAVPASKDWSFKDAD